MPEVHRLNRERTIDGSCKSICFKKRSMIFNHLQKRLRRNSQVLFSYKDFRMGLIVILLHLRRRTWKVSRAEEVSHPNGGTFQITTSFSSATT